MRGCWRAIAKHVPCDRPWGTRASRVPMQAAQADSHLELYLSPVVLTAAIDDSELFELLADTTVCRSYGGWVRAETENAIEKYGCDCDGCACGGTSTSAGFCLTAKMYDSDIDGWNNGEYILTMEDGGGWRPECTRYKRWSCWAIYCVDARCALSLVTFVLEISRPNKLTCALLRRRTR